MSSITNTTIKSYDYLLRDCYSSNRIARKSYGRTSLSGKELANADANALKKVTENLRDMTYSKDNGNNIYNNVKAFVDSYNNLLESSTKCSSKDIEHAEKNLKKFIKEYKDDLEEVGIKMSSSGKLTLNKNKILSTGASKLEKIFTEPSELPKKVITYAKKMSRISKALIQSGNSNDTPAVAQASGTTAGSSAAYTNTGASTSNTTTNTSPSINVTA